MAWNNLTDRQKQLDRLIDSCGVKLEATNSCIEKVARAIGATSNELTFVRQRIELRLRTAALLGETDSFISNTEQMLHSLMNSRVDCYFWNDIFLRKVL